MEKIKIDLSYADKKELRQMYGNYKSIKMYDDFIKNYETKEELIAARKEARDEYEFQFPMLKDAEISLSDLPELIYNKNQLQFIEDAEQTNFEIDYTYSGRGMYGDYCPCIRCDSHNDIDTKAHTKIDSMGLGIVIYAE